MAKTFKKYVIGVDGGGTKTIAALTDLKGKILKMSKTGPSSPRNVGIAKMGENVSKAIEQVLKIISKNDEILATFIGLPTLEEEFKAKKREIKKELLKHKRISRINKGKIIIDSDQIVAFRSVVDEKDGVLLIAGTGCVARGWRGKKNVHVSGWGRFADEGSAFWIGQKVFQAVCKDIDSRGPETFLRQLVFQKLKIKTKEGLLSKVYSKDSAQIVPSFSIICNEASKQGDKMAKDIMIQAGKELAQSVKTVIKKLNFQKQSFPLVLVGGMFKSKIVLETVKKEIKKMAPRVKFVQPKREPVTGAVKLAIDNL